MSVFRSLLICLPAVGAVALVSPADARPASPSPARVAQQVDQALADQLFQGDVELAPRTDDAAFLRRIWIDLTGDIPTPEAVIAFSLDQSEDKRSRLVKELLDHPQYGVNWARYWRDVVFFRRIEERALIAANAMEADLAAQLNENVAWSEIASGFITAAGDVRENGATAIFMAQDGRTEEIAAEVSRIFLGMQIQCAQCHDHPYDRWKREQFHELAAFFPRLGVRNVRTATRRTFAVYASDRARGRGGNNNNGRPVPEHRMPNLNNPDAPGSMMQPKFFLTDEKLPFGVTDGERREQLAEWITKNEWFSIALVNRLWAELVGEGFYELVDDIGPDRETPAPEAARLLAAAFSQSGHDLKWLMETICATEAYQRQSRPRRGPDQTPFVANVPQPLRADQLYNAVLSALDMPENIRRGGRSRESDRPYDRRGDQRRVGFNATFGFDPSDARETISTSIPEALALMNSPQFDNALKARRNSPLGRLLDEIGDDEQLVVELYLRTLNRSPSQLELSRSLEYAAEAGNRAEAFEDLIWALLNSAEFQHRR